MTVRVAATPVPKLVVVLVDVLHDEQQRLLSGNEKLSRVGSCDVIGLWR